MLCLHLQQVCTQVSALLRYCSAAACGGGPLMTDGLSQRKPAHHAALMTNGSCVSHLMRLSVCLSLTLLPLAAYGLDMEHYIHLQ
jgi:hypothetical protein